LKKVVYSSGAQFPRKGTLLALDSSSYLAILTFHFRTILYQIELSVRECDVVPRFSTLMLVKLAYILLQDNHSPARGGRKDASLLQGIIQ
jgi:hypothetical protein